MKVKLSIATESDRWDFVRYLCKRGFEEGEVLTWLAKTRQEDPVELLEGLLSRWGVDEGEYRKATTESKRRFADRGKPELWHRLNAAAEVFNCCHDSILLAAIRLYAIDDELVEEAKYWLKRRKLGGD